MFPFRVIIMRNILICFMVICIATAAGAADIILLDATDGPGSKWRDSFDDGAGTGAAIAFGGSEWIVSGTNKSDLWGRVYQKMEVDLTRYPQLVVDVKSVTLQGYILVVCDKIDKGYLRVETIAAPGTYRIPLAEKLKLEGKQNIQLEIGVTDDGNRDNLKAKMVISEIRLVDALGNSAPSEPAMTQSPAEAAKPAAPQKKSRSIYNNIEKTTSMVKDVRGTDPTGARADVLENGNLKITGTKTTDIWGCVITDISIDFDKPVELAIHVENVTGEGYIIVRHPDLVEGYRRLLPPPTQNEISRYDIKGLLKGRQPVEIQFGVVNNGGKDATGAAMEISKIELVEEAAAESEAREAVTMPIVSASAIEEQVKEFKDAWGDASSGAKATARDGKLVVVGVNTTDVWGCVYRTVEIPFDEDPAIEIDVASVTGEGYVILQGDGMGKEGFVRLTPPPAAAGVYTYTLADFVPLKDKRNLNLQLGVVNPKGPTAVGAEMAIRRIDLLLKKKSN